MARYLDETQTPLIIAAVECNSIGNNRLEEYCPFTCEDPKLGVIRGRGRATMNWFVHEFKPRIDANIRTPFRPEQHVHLRFVNGRTVSLYAATAFNATFGKAACLSPSLWLGRGQNAPHHQSGGHRPDTLIYMDYGGEEMANHTANLSALTSCSTALLKKGVDLTFRIAPGGTHCEASWERQIPVFMKCLGF